MDPKDIKKLRISLKFTQRKFAELFGVTAQTVSNWETGHRRPSSAAVKIMERIKKDPRRGLWE